MAISRIGFTSNSNGDTVASLPTHQAGDILVAWAYRSGVNTLPADPAGAGTWTKPTLSSGSWVGANSNAAILSWHLCLSSAETIPQFTGASEVIIVCYRGVDNTTPFGAVTLAGSALVNDIQYPALTMVDSSGSSWVLGMAGHRNASSGTAAYTSTAPTGMTNVTSVINPGASVLGQAGFHDTDGGVTSWSGFTVALGTGNGHRQVTAELIAAAGGGGGVSVTVPLNTLAISKFAPTVAAGASVATPLKTLAISKFIPTVAAGASVAVPLKTIAIAKFAPTVAAGGNVNISVPVALLTISGKVPLVAAGASVVVPLKSLTLSKFAPGVAAGVSIAIPLKQLTLTKYSPTVTSTDGVSVNVPLSELHLTGFGPSVDAHVSLTLYTNTAYEIYVLTRQNVWEHTRIVFTGNDFGTPQ